MSTTGTTRNSHHNTGLHVEAWGDGDPVVLVHGSLATAAEEWKAQRPLADEGFRLLAPDRRGYGRSPAAAGEDFLRDAEDIAELMGDGAHLVGHSYGGLGVLFAAARRPEATLSLALLEPGTFALGQRHPAARALVDAVRRIWRQDVPDEEWVVDSLKAVGSDPDEFPPDFLAAALPLVPVLRRGRPMFHPDLPLEQLAAAPFPRLVVSGGHRRGSTPSATTSRSGAAPPERSLRAQGTRSSSPVRPSTTRCWRSGAPSSRRAKDRIRQVQRGSDQHGKGAALVDAGARGPVQGQWVACRWSVVLRRCMYLRGLVADDGEVLVQDPDRHNWGGLLRPGRYAAIELEEARQSCIFINQDGPPLSVFGESGWDVSITGEPWHPQP